MYKKQRKSCAFPLKIIPNLCAVILALKPAAVVFGRQTGVFSEKLAEIMRIFT